LSKKLVDEKQIFFLLCAENKYPFRAFIKKEVFMRGGVNPDIFKKRNYY